MIFPVLVALVPLVFRRQVVRIVAAIVMGGFVFISGFSIGLFYLPAGILMKAVAARQRDAARQPPEVRQEVGDCGRKDGVSSKLQRVPGRFRRC